MRVRHDEGVAIRVGPEPCAVARAGAGEASAGDGAGQPLSRVSEFIPGADSVSYVEGNTDGHAIASAHLTRRGLRPWHALTLLPPIRPHVPNRSSRLRSTACGVEG